MIRMDYFVWRFLMALQFIPIVTDEQIHTLAFMADTVWHEWFHSILSVEQIDYMVKKFQLN